MSITIKKVDARIPEVFPPLWRRLAFPLAGLSVMVAVLCYILYFSVEKEDPQTIPLIQAEPGPYRVKPENPGGRSVPHQDKLVYERLSLQEQPEYEAQFIPAVEDPIDLQQLGAEKGIAELAQEFSQPLPVERTPPTPDQKISTPPVAASAEVSKTQHPMVKPPAALKKTIVPAMPVIPMALPGAAKPTLAKTSSTRLYRVQLASSRSADILVKEWKRLQQLYPDIFKNYQPSYLRLKEDTGIYYALRVGNFSTLAMVKKLHQKLQQKKINCKIIETP